MTNFKILYFLALMPKKKGMQVHPLCSLEPILQDQYQSALDPAKTSTAVMERDKCATLMHSNPLKFHH